MIFDAQLILSDGQAIWQQGATAASSNIYDMGAATTANGASGPSSRDVGKGCAIPIDCQVTQPFNNLTSLEIQVQVSAAAAFAAPTIVFRSPAYPLSSLQLGARRLLPDTIPVGTNQQFLRLLYVMTGTLPTMGKITAGIVEAWS